MIAAVALALALATSPAPGDEDDAAPAGAPRRDTIEGDAPPRRDTIEGSKPRRTPPKARPKPRPAPVPAGPVEIPIDIGVGPQLLLPNPGPVFDDGPIHFGLAISLAAVVDQELIRKYAGRIPAQYRGMARNLDEVRVRPWFLAIVPELLVISPPTPVLHAHTGMYGAVWRPIGIGVSPISDPVRVSIGANLDVAYLFIHSETLGGGVPGAPSFTHFLRPGVNLDLTVEMPLSKAVFVSTGWSSDLFIPQPIGGTPLDIAPLDQALWHLGGPFLKLHVRIPYEVDL